MAVNNVSTYGLFQSTLTDISKIEAELAQQQAQLSSGNKSQDFTGIANQTQEFLSVSAIITRTNQYLDDNQVVETRVNTTSSILDQVINTTTSLQSLISQRRSGVADNSAFATQLNGLWQTLVGQLNTSVDGQYLFSGTKITSPAVDPDHFPVLQSLGIPDDGYYQGSKQDMTVRAQDNVLLTYNVRADAPAFQKIFAGLATAAHGDDQNNPDQLAQSYDLVQQGLQEVIAIQATVNANKVQLSSIDQNHQTIKLYWQGIKENIGNTDVLSVSTQVAINQGILQAAFQAFAKISSLRLSDFLR